jgi:hypothetical protein
MTTPAIVGWTPDSYVASQMPAPTTKYAGPRQTSRRRRSTVRAMPAAAAASGRSRR